MSRRYPCWSLTGMMKPCPHHIPLTEQQDDDCHSLFRRIPFKVNGPTTIFVVGVESGNSVRDDDGENDDDDENNKSQEEGCVQFYYANCGDPEAGWDKTFAVEGLVRSDRTLDQQLKSAIRSISARQKRDSQDVEWDRLTNRPSYVTSCEISVREVLGREVTAPVPNLALHVAARLEEICSRTSFARNLRILPIRQSIFEKSLSESLPPDNQFKDREMNAAFDRLIRPERQTTEAANTASAAIASAENPDARLTVAEVVETGVRRPPHLVKGTAAIRLCSSGGVLAESAMLLFSTRIRPAMGPEHAGTVLRYEVETRYSLCGGAVTDDGWGTDSVWGPLRGALEIAEETFWQELTAATLAPTSERSHALHQLQDMEIITNAFGYGLEKLLNKERMVSEREVVSQQLGGLTVRHVDMRDLIRSVSAHKQEVFSPDEAIRWHGLSIDPHIVHEPNPAGQTITLWQPTVEQSGPSGAGPGSSAEGTTLGVQDFLDNPPMDLPPGWQW